MPRKDPAKQREYWNRWYKSNPANQRARVAQRKREIRDWLINYKQGLKCSKCDESHPATLDFHHREPKEKEENITYAVARGWSLARIQAEIAKCDVLCSNCHRKHHWDVV